MIVLSAPGELSPNTKELLRKEVKEKTDEECIVLDCGVELTQISVKKDSATGGDQLTRAGRRPAETAPGRSWGATGKE